MKNWSALLVLASGIALSYWSFAWSTPHSVDESVLWYFGQCLVYAGSVFSLKNFLGSELRDLLDKSKKTTATPSASTASDKSDKSTTTFTQKEL